MAMPDLVRVALLASLVGLALYQTTVPRRVFCTRRLWPWNINFTVADLLLMLLTIQPASCIRRRNKNEGVIMNAKPILSRWDYAQLQTIAANAERYPMNHESLHALQRKLDSALLLSAEDIPADVVTMHSKVRLLDHKADTVRVWRLVYPSSDALEKDRLSVLAPLGLAILGRQVGDLVECPVPSGWARFTILKIAYQPEAESRYLERMSMGPPLRLTR